MQNLFSSRSFLWINLQQGSNHAWQVTRELMRNLGVNAFDHSVIQSFHVFSRKWRWQCCHLIQNCTEWPDVRRLIIWLILPNFRWCVIRRSSLCLHLIVFCDLAHVKITKFHSAIFRQENVCVFNVSVDYLLLVKVMETCNHLVENRPNLCLLHKLWSLLALVNFWLEVAAVCILHNDAEGAGWLFEEGLLVACDVGVVDWGQDTHFVDSILFFLCWQLAKFDLSVRMNVIQTVLLS